MKRVNVDKDALLEAMQKNRRLHRETFEEALEGYKEEVITQLELRLEDARKGKQVSLFIALEQPKDQTKDYDRAIKMVEMSIDDFIELSESEFACYVMDEWSWKEQFANVTANYTKMK